ncbi:MAG: CPXCG motif-containing cysteine-rich protein [Bdellovibrionota bacterium]
MRDKKAIRQKLRALARGSRFRSSRDDEARVQCPYCFERQTIPVDSGGAPIQSFSYDCRVCCQPIAVTVELSPEGRPTASAERES